MSGDPLRLGLVGAGWHAVHDHLPALAAYAAAHPDAVRVDAVCDPRAEAAAAVAAEHPGCAVFADPDDLLAAGTCDAVLALTPPALNAPIAIRLLEAGMPVLMEKPIGADRAEAEAVCAAAAAHPTPVMVGFNRRFDPYLSAARAAIAERPVLRARATLIRHGRTRDIFVADVGAHVIDLLTATLGALTCRSVEPWAGAGSGCLARLATTDGRPVDVDLVPTGGMHLERYEFIGQDWRVTADAAGAWRLFEDGAEVAGTERPTDEPQAVANGTRAETAAFVDGLRTDRELHPTPTETMPGFDCLQEILARCSS